MKKRYCCERFESYVEDSLEVLEGQIVAEHFPSIKIVKGVADKFNNGKNLYSFLIICGFIKDNPPTIVIAFCPFCGKNLFKYYKDDKYVQGTWTDVGLQLYYGNTVYNVK